MFPRLSVGTLVLDVFRSLFISVEVEWGKWHVSANVSNVTNDKVDKFAFKVDVVHICSWSYLRIFCELSSGKCLVDWPMEYYGA